MATGRVISRTATLLWLGCFPWPHTLGSVMGRRKGVWENAWLGVATLSCSQSSLSVPSSACTVQCSWVTKVQHAPTISAGLIAAWRRSKFQHCLDKSASYQMQHHNFIKQAQFLDSARGFGTGNQESTLAHAASARTEADVDTDFDVSSNTLKA